MTIPQTAPSPGPQKVRASFRDLERVVGKEEQESGIACLMQGPAFSGKTWNALTWPNPYFVYWDPNDATLKNFPGVRYIAPTLDLWRREILPAIRNREIDAETIVIDTWSYFAMLRLEQIFDEVGNVRDPRKPVWNRFLDENCRDMNNLLESKKPDAFGQGRRHYNIVVNAHETEHTDSEGRVNRIRAAIGGAFKDMLPRFFDVTLICAKEMVNETVDETTTVNGKAVTRSKFIKVPKYFVYTEPQGILRIGGDRLGTGKRYRKLPYKMGGTYPELCEAWGIKQ